MFPVSPNFLHNPQFQANPHSTPQSLRRLRRSSVPGLRPTFDPVLLKREQEGWSNRPLSLAYHVDDISLTLGTYVLADLVVWIQVSDSLDNPRFRVCPRIFNRELNF